MGGEGFEPTKPKQQIYSLSHLTTLETSHHYQENLPKGSGANRGTRTHDRLITNQLLYQLSYIGRWVSYLCRTAQPNTFAAVRPWRIQRELVA